MPGKDFTVDINPAVLRCARETSGYSVAEAGERIGTPGLLAAWESGKARPTWIPLDRLAKLYKRPIAALLLADPPTAASRLPHAPGQQEEIVAQDAIRHPNGEMCCRYARTTRRPPRHWPGFRQLGELCLRLILFPSLSARALSCNASQSWCVRSTGFGGTREANGSWCPASSGMTARFNVTASGRRIKGTFNPWRWRIGKK